MADNNTVKYGLKKVYYAKATINNVTHTATYGTPVPWPGAVSLSLDAQGELTKFRADDIDYWIGNSNQGYEGDYESALIPESFKTDILGYVTDGNGVVFEDAEAEASHFALLFEFNGDKHATRHVMYNCTATRPSATGQTTEENLEPQTETLTIAAASIYDAALQKEIVKGSTTPETDAAAYASWYQAVYTPDTDVSA